MASEPSATPSQTAGAATVSTLPPTALEFAHRMFDAAREGNAELLLAAVDAGLPINLANDKGNTFLMLAAYADHVELARSLLVRRADPDRLNDRAQSPLAGAVFKGHADVVHALVGAGADPTLGRPSAVEAAVMFGRNDMLDVLGASEGEVQSVGRRVPIGPGAAVEAHRPSGRHF